MKMKLWMALAVLPLVTLCAAETGKTDVKPAAAVQQVKPEWKGNSIVAGNRKVEFPDSGIITIQTGNLTVLNVCPYFSLRTAEGKGYWAAPNNKPFKITLNNDGKSIQYAGDMTIEGKTWQAFTEKAELTPEGLIHVTVNWKMPPQELNWKCHVSLSMSSTYEAMGGSQLKINQDSVKLPAAHDPKAQPGLGAFWKGSKFVFTFLADSPDKAFSILGDKAKNIQGFWVARNMLFRTLSFVSYPDLKKSSLEFDIDIRGESK